MLVKPGSPMAKISSTSKGLLQVAIKIILRISIPLILVAMTILGVIGVDRWHTQRLQQQLARYAAETAGYTERWQFELLSLPRNLIRDDRIHAALTGKTAGDYSLVRQALYEFGYKFGIPDIYISAAGSDQIIMPATAITPEGDLRREMRHTSAMEDASAAFTTLQWSDQDYVFLTLPIRGREFNRVIGKLGFIQPVADTLTHHYQPLYGTLERAEVMLADLASPQGATLIRKAFQPDYQSVQRLPFALRGVLERGKRSIEAPINPGDAAHLLGMAPVPNAPGWFVLLGVDAYTAHHAVRPYQILIILCGLFAVLTAILWPMRKQLFTNEGKTSLKQVSKITETGAMDYRDIATVMETSQRLFGERQPTSTPIQTRDKTPERKLADVIEASLEKKRTRLLFQPIVDSQTRQVIMHEVFLRILDAQGKVITPNLFIPVVQRYKLFAKLDEHVIQRIIDEYLAPGIVTTKMAINLGTGSLESMAFLDALEKNLDPAWSNRLVMELRSREIAGDKHAIEFVTKCHDLGCLASTDYFGGGMPMLKAAKRMTFDYVKLDSLNMQDLESKKELIRLAEVAKTIDLGLVLERVEEPNMLALAAKAGIDYVQGYYLAKPHDVPYPAGTILKSGADAPLPATAPSAQTNPPRPKSTPGSPSE